MAREPTMNLTMITADALSVQERVLLFCLASATPWQKAGVTERTVLNMVIRGIVEREPGAQLSLTRQGREAFVALIEGAKP
jgi:hypothetical protein